MFSVVREANVFNAGGGMYMLDDVTRNTRHCTTLMKCAEGALVGAFA